MTSQSGYLAAREALPYRGEFGQRRPHELAGLALPPAPMPARDGLRPLKCWRYVGAFGPQLMLCAASVRIGRARQSFWAVWDRTERRLYERTALGHGEVALSPGRLRVMHRDVQIDLRLAEEPGIEAVCADGSSYAWTRKQAGVRAVGTVALGGEVRAVELPCVIDDTAAYYARHTHWRWSAGVGLAEDGRELAWNLVSGVNDPAVGSERTVWVEREAIEPPPSSFSADLLSVDGLRFTPEAVRERSDNLLLLRSSYRQPFGTFSGVLPGGIVVAQGHGVMEEHDARW